MTSSKKNIVNRNIVSNIIGQAGVTCLVFLFAPICINNLGADAYGLIGLFGLVYTWLSVFDFGINSAVSREAALFKAEKNKDSALGGLLSIGEAIYLALAGLLVAFLCIYPDFFINSNEYENGEKLAIVFLMGTAAGLKLLEMLYISALKGMQEQVWFNAYNLITNTIRWGGASILIMYAQADIRLVFLWIAICAVISAFSARVKVFQYIKLEKSTYKKNLESLRVSSGFLVGSFSIAVVSFFVGQSDKIVINKYYGLETFGYYSIAITCAGGLYVLVNAVNSAVYPRLIDATVHEKDSAGLWLEYFKYSKRLSFVLIAASMVLFNFPSQILLFWTGSMAVSDDSSRFLKILTIGVMFHGLNFIPYSMQLAKGWTDIALKNSLILGAFYVLSFYYITSSGYSALAVAYAFSIMCFISFLLSLVQLHSRIFKGFLYLYLKDICFVPIVAFGLPLFLISKLPSL